MHNHENKAARSFASLTMADCITLLRIVGTAGLLFFLPLSPAFFLLYTFTGVTDVLDGWVARKTGTCSDAGARLDSIADLLFYGVTIVKLLPILYRILPKVFWLMVLAAAALRVASYAIAGMKFGCFASLHTYLNKLTGAAVFLVPFFLRFSCGEIYCWIILAVAGIASAEELLIHLFSREYRPNRKSLFLQDAIASGKESSSGPDKTPQIQ